MRNLDDTRRTAQRFGRYLRSLRLQRGWTQSLAGNAIGVDSVTIRRWELGMFSPSANRISQVAEAYDVEVSELIGASSADAQEVLPVNLPVIGFLDSGTELKSQEQNLGSFSFPSHMVLGNANVYCLQVNGDCLAPDGILDGDILVVCPGQLPTMGSLCVIKVGQHVRAAAYIEPHKVRIWTATGTGLDLDITPEQMSGTVIWHVKKMKR